MSTQTRTQLLTQITDLRIRAASTSGATARAYADVISRLEARLAGDR